MRSTRPNILVIMSDEHDPAVTGCYGDKIVQTPNLDQLATEGVTFDACYTTSPLCVPARLSFTAGQYVSRCRAWNNNCRLPEENENLLPQVLGAAGYESFLCGKMHYDRDRRYGFNDLIPDDRCNQARKEGRGGRRDPASTSGDTNSWENRTSQFFTGEVEESFVMTADRRRTEVACDFLQNRQSEDKPFFMMLGYLAPHFPLIVPEAYHKKYIDRVPMPELPEDWFERLPTNYQQLITGFGVDRNDKDIVKFGRELYWAFVEWMDNEIGTVLSTLDKSGVSDNTIVIYTSDHGENKGDHGMWWKNNMFEHSARIPFIARWPGHWPANQRRSGACSLVDMVQTIADVAGAEAPDSWDGDSLLSYIDNADATWKDMAVSEYYAHNISSGFAMLRQGEWKYVYHTRANDTTGPEVELYNLSQDPEEWTNLAQCPDQARRISEMHQRLVKEVDEEPEASEARCRAEYAEGYQLQEA